MKHVGIKEFRDRARGKFRTLDPIAVECDGKVIGFHIPVDTRTRSEEELSESIDRLEASVRRVLEETGMTEDEFADYFDLSKPPDYPPGGKTEGEAK